MHVPTNRKGFALVEIIILLTVLTVAVAIAIPVTLRIFQETSEDATRTEMQNLKQAMIGNPNKLNDSQRSDFGFLGDIGRLPTTLDDVFTIGTLPSFSFNTGKQAGAGWNGPYISGSFAGEAPQDFKNDQWGNPYTYSDTNYVNGNGQAVDGKIVSAGQDGVMGTADDITVEILVNEDTATATGIVKAADGGRFPSVPVDMNYPVNGALSTITATTNASGVYTFTSIPFGRRSVQARPTLGYSSNSAVAVGGQNLQFTIYNFSTSSVTVSSLTATFNSPGTCYQGIRWNGTQVNNQTRCSGQTANFSSSRTLAGSATIPPPQVSFIDRPNVQLPDLIISGRGNSAFIQLLNFGNNVDGVQFTVTFSNGSVISFTPVLG